MTAAAFSTSRITLGTPGTEGLRLWIVRSDEARAESLRALLNDDESEHADRLAVQSDRLDAIVSRGLWRTLAGEMLGQPGEAVEVERTAFGRSVPSGIPRSRGDLGVSSARGLVLLAGASGGVRLGVDLEHRLSATHDERLAQACEGIAGPALELVPDRVERTICCWCLHRALLQADGRGLHLGPGSVTAEIRSLWGWNQARVSGVSWWVRRLRMPEGYEGAIASSSPVEDLAVIDLDDAARSSRAG